ncbi:MAG TPA: TMEM175 family protein [Candidatus Baltobacteraceae bacterium]|nr:TMEM175 family protein [Candidatus Baltobacteraceae bacterium]
MNQAAADERTVHRLEAFSDIVIGFGLAQLGAILTFDSKTVALTSVGVIAFFGAFAIVCSLWYFHHRLFENFFVPKALPIVLNFLWLAIVVLLVYCAAHFDSARAFAERDTVMLYFGLYASAYAILALQTTLGIRARPNVEPQLRDKARRNILFMSLWTAIFAVCFALVATMPPTQALGQAIDATFAIGAICSISMGAYFRRRRGVTNNA